MWGICSSATGQIKFAQKKPLYSDAQMTINQAAVFATITVSVVRSPNSSSLMHSFGSFTTAIQAHRQRGDIHARHRCNEIASWGNSVVYCKHLPCARFMSLARSMLRLCLANHRSGYFSNLTCNWLSIVWAYFEQEKEIWPWKTLLAYHELKTYGNVIEPDAWFCFLMGYVVWLSLLVLSS